MTSATNVALEDASIFIIETCNNFGKDTEDIPEINLKIVNCNLAIRWFNSIKNLIPDGATSTSSSVGDFSQSISFSNPTSTRNFYLTKNDRILLGLYRKSTSIYLGEN